MPTVNEADLIHELQRTQLKILLELDRVCKLLNVEYCLAFGSCLGAVRHKGFIPWDDDIDVYMRVEDLEVLQQHSELFNEPFYLQYAKNELGYGLMVARLRNSNTTLIEVTEVDRDINHGVFIDIYPLFNTPKGGMGAKRLLIASMVYRLMLYGVPPKNRGIIMKVGSTFLLSILPKSMRQHLIEYCYSVMKSSKDNGYLTSLYGDEASIRYPANWFFPVKWVPFENILLPIEANADEYLKMTYGEYMVLPPEDKRAFHHCYVVVDLENSYLKYRGIKYCVEQ